MSLDTFLYFAYGSNMLSRRMLARTPSARRVGLAALPDFELRWHKVSKDGSGKCDIVATPGRSVQGVLYEIAAAERPALDVAEGLGAGYREVQLEVRTVDGVRQALSYQATNIDSFTKPYSWYKALVVAGAKEQGLDAAYVETLEAAPSWDDRNSQRAAENLRQLKAG
jgi:cation transport regulator ChaC